MTDRIINDSKPLSLLPEYNQVKAEKCAVVSFLNPIPTDREKFFYPITSESEKKYLDYLSSFLDDLRNNFQNPSFFFFFPPEI